MFLLKKNLMLVIIWSILVFFSCNVVLSYIGVYFFIIFVYEYFSQKLKIKK
jgi:hypothetical protein